MESRSEYNPCDLSSDGEISSDKEFNAHNFIFEENCSEVMEFEQDFFQYDLQIQVVDGEEIFNVEEKE